jgi:hypothetical protein
MSVQHGRPQRRSAALREKDPNRIRTSAFKQRVARKALVMARCKIHDQAYCGLCEIDRSYFFGGGGPLPRRPSKKEADKANRWVESMFEGDYWT